jgi:uncharacterized protein
MRKRLALILLSCVLCVAATAQQPTLTVGTATAVSGQIVTGFIEVSEGSDVGTNIPAAVIRGPKPGPTLAVVAGAHGTEYASIVALEKLMQELNPAEISGTVIIVPLVNITSFEQKVPREGRNTRAFR